VSHGAPFLDPELRGLLHEVASAPAAEVLRGGGPPVLAGLDELCGGGRARTFDLSLAERELLRTYRDEIAWLLRQTWLREVYGDPARRLSRSLRVDRELELPTGEAWRRRRDRALDDCPPRAGVEDALDLLGRWMLGGPGRPDTYRLVLASNRIAPSDAARIHLAHDLAHRGETASGLRLLRSVLALPLDALLASIAWENLGWVHAQRGELREAMVAYRESALAAEDRPVPLTHWLLGAAGLGDRRESLEAARRLDALVPGDHGAVHGVLEGFALRRRNGEWRPPAGAGAFVASLPATLGPASKKVTDAFV